MKHWVRFSVYSVIISIVVIILYCWVYYLAYSRNQEIPIWIASSALLLLVVGAVIYMPLYVELKDDVLVIRRPLKSKKILLSDIEQIELCMPTMGEIRLLGSGGWFGYWGWFKEKDLGKYFAYYGKASDCFFLVLKNGKRYMIGCKNPKLIVDKIKTLISTISDEIKC